MTQVAANYLIGQKEAQLFEETGNPGERVELGPKEPTPQSEGKAFKEFQGYIGRGRWLCAEQHGQLWQSF